MMLRIEIHLCCEPECPEPPAFVVGGNHVPICAAHYRAAEIAARLRLRGKPSTEPHTAN